MPSQNHPSPEKFRIKTIIASEIAPLDSNVHTGGGTDVTDALQAALDEARTCGGVRLVMDGAALVRMLNVHSNTTIECLTPDCGFFQKAQTNRSIISNVNWDRYNHKDRNISLIGGTYNQNCRHQEHHVLWKDVHHLLPTQDPQHDRKIMEPHEYEVHWVLGLEFYGVENLLIRDVIMRDFRTFAVAIGGFRNVLIENVWLDLPNRMRAENQDGLHFWGPGRFLTVRNVGGSTGDDFMNIGPDEMDGVSSIEDVLVDGVFLDDADDAIRMLTTGTGRLDRVTIRNVTGSYRSYGFYLNPWFPRATYGNFGNILFENIDLRQTAPNYDYRPPLLFNIAGNIECMTFRNIRHHKPRDNRTLFEIGVPFYKLDAIMPEDNKPRMKNIIIDGLTVIEEPDASAGTGHIQAPKNANIDGVFTVSAAAAGTEYIQVHGEVDRLMVNNATVLRAPGLKPAGTLLAMKERGKIGTLHLSHVHTEGVETLVAGKERIARTLSHQVETDAKPGSKPTS